MENEIKNRRKCLYNLNASHQNKKKGADAAGSVRKRKIDDQIIWSADDIMPNVILVIRNSILYGIDFQ